MLPMISSSLAEYALTEGYLQHWLMAGPRVLSARPGQPWPAAETNAFSQPVVEGQTVQIADEAFIWRYAKTLNDHLLDAGAWLNTAAGLEAWAYCQLASLSAAQIQANLTSYGPAELWLDGQRVDLVPDPAHPSAGGNPWRASRWLAGLPLKAGPNHLLVRFGRLPGAASPCDIALQMAPSAAEPLALKIQLPIITTQPSDRADYEAVLETAYLDREIYTHGEWVPVRWSATPALPMRFNARLQQPNGRIYAEAYNLRAEEGSDRQIEQPNTGPDGPYQVLLLPDTLQYHHEQRLRVTRVLPLYLAGADYAEQPSSDFAQRRVKGLIHAASRPDDLHAELAKLALGWWAKLDAAVIRANLVQVQQHAAGYPLALAGLVNLLFHYGPAPDFPPALKVEIEAGLLAAHYAPDPAEPDTDAALLLRVAQLFAGQLFPEQVFSSDGQTGRWHQQQAEPAILNWLRRRGTAGSPVWDTGEVIQAEVVALSALLALEDDSELAGLASVALDQTFFGLGLNAFKGTFGSTHARASTASVLSGRLEPTAGLGWLLWGLGILNEHIAGLVSLTHRDDYLIPEVLAAIATDQPAELWNREAHGALEAHSTRPTVYKVTYKTPDYMLASAQDFAAGEPGDQEHIWQATLGPDAVVFVNQPACLNRSDVFRPNFWRGNVRLPRVAQWQDSLLARYQAPAGEGLGFTHAYFPVYAFDDYLLQAGWAFARRGQGYLALTAAHGLELTAAGDNAYRELRSPGRENVWLCQMGRAALDGSFSDFQKRVKGQAIALDGLTARWTSLHGDKLAFGWQDPLQVNDVAQPLSDFRHYDNPYTKIERGAASIEILHGGQGLRLIFD
jgi:hypothetical protein